FSGYTDSSNITHGSAAHGKPAAGGQSINIAASQAVGSETQIVYHQPVAPTSSDCVATTDNTPNISQVGRGSNTSTGQVKLQLSNCTIGQPVFPACRIWGENNNV